MDAEWDRISESGWILLSRTDILALGKDPSTRSRASPELVEAMGLDRSGECYHGMVNAFHQLHCLNITRKHAYWDSYYAPIYGSWDAHNADELHWTHVSHCFEMLCQNLICNADAGVISSMWMDGQSFPFSDFNLKKKCGDFKGLRGWEGGHRVPDEFVDLVGRPPKEDIEVLFDAPPELYAAKGVETPEGYVSDHVVVEEGRK